MNINHDCAVMPATRDSRSTPRKILAASIAFTAADESSYKNEREGKILSLARRAEPSEWVSLIREESTLQNRKKLTFIFFIKLQYNFSRMFLKF